MVGNTIILSPPTSGITKFNFFLGNAANYSNKNGDTLAEPHCHRLFVYGDDFRGRKMLLINGFKARLTREG